MRREVLLDAGPLVAFLSRRDEHHQWALAQWKARRLPLLTCEAVLTEVCFLLRSVRGGSDSVMEFIERGAVAVPFRLQDETARVRELMFRYRDVPMSLADACLVRMAEQNSGAAVWTLDSDFRRYRKHGRQRIPTLTPEP